MNGREFEARVAAFLAGKAGGPVKLARLRRFPVGFSWGTFGVEIEEAPEGSLPARSLILRVGPPDGLFAPYRAEPQFRVLSALARSRVPTPAVYWFSDDPGILGFPFFFCEMAPGRAPLPSTGEPGDPVPEHGDSLGRQFVEALADLHMFDWRAAPELAGWGGGIDAENSADRQIGACLDEYGRLVVRPEPAVAWAIDWLRANTPPARHLAIVHGDFRIGNFLVNEGRITALLDWEAAHIGDPHEDLGWAMLPQFGGGTGKVCRMLAERDFLDLYSRRSGIDIDRRTLAYYTAMALLRLALVNLAAARRFEATDTSDIRTAALGTQATSTLRQMQKFIGSIR